MFISGRPLIELKDLKKLFGRRSYRFNVPAYPFSNGREALKIGLDILPLKEGARIWIPAYICRSVVEVAHKKGLRVMYYDIGENLQPALETLKAGGEDVILTVHYFGLSQNLQKVKRLFRDTGILIIEDGAHTFPYLFCGRYGKEGDMAIFSLRKILPVPDGGILIVNREDLKDRLCSNPNPRGILDMALLIMCMEKLASWFGINLIRFKKHFKNSFGSKDSGEVHGISWSTLKLLYKMDFKTMARRRVENFYRLVHSLTGVEGISLPFRNLPKGSIPQVLPIWSENAKSIVARLRNRGIEAYEWPGKELPSEIDIERFPGTKKWVEKGIMLPLHHSLKERHIKWILKEIEKAVS